MAKYNLRKTTYEEIQTKALQIRMSVRIQTPCSTFPPILDYSMLLMVVQGVHSSQISVVHRLPYQIVSFNGR